MNNAICNKAAYLLATTAMLGTMSVASLPQAAHAQALQPAVDVCTGITLPRSAVTEVIGAVNQPIVDQIETTVNGITTVTLVLDPLANITDLNLDLSSILDDAAQGDPITLQVLDTDGNVVTPSDACNVTADGYTLDEEGGVAIGGNRITGLGANGQEASAAELDAIAIGNNASTAAGATGAVALGTGASVTAENGVALGAGSVADRGPQIGYAAPGLAGTYDSVGSVSVGAAGAERQITNVAPGTADSDAATVGQVMGAVAQATADSVQYDDASHGTVTLDGADGTVVTNLADGELSATSSDAVNGSQLYATNQQVAANTDAIDDLDGRVTQNETDIDNIDTRVTINEQDISQIDDRVTVNEGDIANIDSRVTVNEGDITDLDVRVTDNSTQITNIQAQVANVPVGYVSDADGMTPSATPTDTAAFMGASGGTVRVTNVADATLAADSADAVNGSQLYATNQQVAQNRTDIDQNTADITEINNNLQGSTVVAVQYSDPDTPTASNGGTVTQDVTFVGADGGQPVSVHNVADATAGTDAVNLRQVQAGFTQLQSNIDQTLVDANAYTDMRIAELGFDLRDLRDEAFAGTAAAMALATIPQTMEPGKSMVGGSIGHYRGETAFGFGVSATANDGKVVFKAGGTLDTHGRGGVAAGAGFSF